MSCARRGGRGAAGAGLSLAGPSDVARIDKLIAAVIRSDLDAITFTSAPAVAALFTRAKELGKMAALTHAMRTSVPASAWAR